MVFEYDSIEAYKRNRRHGYADLEPYVCLFLGCSLGLHTFESRKDWMDHEFQVHRVQEIWTCGLREEKFHTQRAFRDHITTLNVHNIRSFEPSQIEELVRSSKNLRPRDAEKEQCLFCLKVPSSTQKGFASHVGRHQQEMSLAALPRLELDDDSGEDDESKAHSEKITESDLSSLGRDISEGSSIDKENKRANDKEIKSGM